MRAWPLWRNFNEVVVADVLTQLRHNDLSPEDAVRMIGLVFARPEIGIVSEQILPNLGYFDVRAHGFTTFYFAGYYDLDDHKKYYYRAPSEAGAKPVANVNGRRWAFSNERFNEIREKMEHSSKWKYTGSVDLVLTNARIKRVEDTEGWYESILDLQTAISVDLAEMLKAKAISSVNAYFEEIFRYTERQTGIDPTWGFSDHAVPKLAGSALKRFVLSLIPKALRPEIERAEYYAVRDLSGQKRIERVRKEALAIP